MDDCFCGVCPGCRRSLKVERRTSAPPKELSPLVVQIMQERTRPRPKESLFAQPDQPDKPKGPRYSHRNPNKLSTEELYEERKKRRAETKKQNRAERELIDGVLVHPYAPHGTSNGYNWYGCKCRPCKDSQNRHGAASRENKRNARTSGP